MAADFLAPSFSLGLDLDSDDDANQQDKQQGEPSVLHPPNQEEDLESGEALDRHDLEEPRRPPLKRLRRGLPSPPPTVASSPRTFAEEGQANLDDDIEDFSSPERGERQHPDVLPSLQSHAACSSSKVSLHYRGVLNSQSASKSKTPKIPQCYATSAPKSSVASSSKDFFPRLTISPLRKIHLLDSDSGEPSPSKGNIHAEEVDLSNKKKKGVCFQSSIRNDEKKFQSHKHSAESFWKDFSPKETSKLETPVLDEFCNEYFKEPRNQQGSHRKEQAPSYCSSRILDPDDPVDDFEDLPERKDSYGVPDSNWDSHYPKPPAYEYFCHDDSRIRALIRERLPHFTPIGIQNDRGTQQFAEDDLDYMGQFGSRDGSSQVRATSRKGSERNISRRQKQPTNANSKKAFQATGNWVNPKDTATIPKDAGKRRVSAVGGQTGHWFTGEDGRKVYISRNGQELTGQVAYRQYKKESGAVFRKAKKKAPPKKKNK